MFRECCRWGLKITDDELRFWALKRNDGQRHPLDRAEVEGIVESVCRYRARWRVQGHDPRWLALQASFGRKGKGRTFNGAVRASLFDDLSNEAAKPWAVEGISRAWWYRKRQRARP